MSDEGEFFIRSSRIWKLLLLVQILLLLPLLACATSFSGMVVKVSDGDTIEVMQDGRVEKVRLSGIDCPEEKQSFGREAKRFTSGLAAQKIVTVKVETTDRYGRTVGEVVLPDGKSLNRELVSAGYAWWFRKYSSDTTLGQLESKARASRLGLWTDSNPVPPWEWRHGEKKVASPTEPMQGFSGDARECRQKRLCKEMISCEEAMFFLRDCGLSSLDRDGDGIPCESLCR